MTHCTIITDGGEMEMDMHELEKRLDFIEFRQELLFEDTIVSRLLFEHKITRTQHKQIIGLMDEYRDLILAGKKVSHHTFEQKVYDIVPQINNNYHFVEHLVKGYHEIGGWEEVFETLYGYMPKYQNYLEQKDKK
jgi:hypothetical protein